ncbi:antiterminator LoaP [Paenibacillus sp. PsM32]|uniref:antiterminator LoaP n=1 Tax=Paenibacillus sp. PsM32 TaxID=3030536 RepID=UPI00263BAC95|nr:antiterminator LoaP [Paenibacillus sp. PsM32]MDN4618078.1 antiterminator LoaP [Paenibacillus sp. PsM32]
MSWYTFFVQTGKEDYIKKHIDRHYDDKQLKCMIPKRIIPEKRQGIVKDEVKVLFPGYIFVKTHMIQDVYHSIKTTPHVYYLVGSSSCTTANTKEYFTKIPENQMNWLLQLFGQNHIIGYSDIMVLDENVQVISGPLMGKEAIIRKIDKRKGRAKIEVQLLNDIRLIDVGIEILSP